MRGILSPTQLSCSQKLDCRNKFAEVPLQSDHPSFTLLSKLRSRDFSVIEKICSLKEEETLHLEFKAKHDPSTPDLSSSDRSNLGSLLSGFSNADGGVVIWGITNGKAHGKDVAEKPEPIADVETFVGTLQDLCVKWLSPNNSGIEVFSIPTSNDKTKGCVVMVIPRGDNRPYMSNAAGHRNYWRKTATSIVNLEHYEVVDLMRSVSNPTLDIGWAVTHQGSQATHYTFSIDLYLINVSQVIADEPYVLVPNWPRRIPPRALNGFVVTIDPPDLGNQAMFMSSPMKMLVPGAKMLFGALDIIVPRPMGEHAPRWRVDAIFEHSFGMGNVTLYLSVGAKNGSTRPYELELPEAEILAKCQKALDEFIP